MPKVTIPTEKQLDSHPNEIWIQCEGYKDHYFVSNHGRVKSIDYVTEHKGKRHFFTSRKGLLMKPKINTWGYYTLSIVDMNGNKKWPLIHRLIAKAFIQNPYNYPIINHKDGNKLNNSIDNLEWCDNDYNMAHAKANNLFKPLKGEKQALAKLKNKDVLEIVRRGSLGEVQRFLAKEYSISPSQINGIIKGKAWKSVTGL